jgi:GT2 family glycosyltransferase
MLSIIVAVHNQIGHNRLFLEGIRRYTAGSYELIIVDNHSTDGSREYFEENGCRVIRNEVNLCYPESMNQGIRLARGEHLCFLNNDVYVGPNWNQLLIEALDKHNLDVVSPLGLEQMPTNALTGWMYDRWAAIGQGRHPGRSEPQLRELVCRMYGDWERFCAEIYQAFRSRLIEGIVGSCVLIKRSLLEKIGPWDERIQAADWDIYFRVRKREAEVGDVHRVMIVGWSFIHHFIRATVKGKHEPFACRHLRLSLDEKWKREEQMKLWYKPWDFSPDPSSKRPFGRMRGRFGKSLKKIRQGVRRVFARRSTPADPGRTLEIYRGKFRELG